MRYDRRRMKVLLATMQFGRGYGQGTERYLAMLADGLSRRGHEAVILAGDPERRGPALPLGTEFEQEPRVLYYPTHGRLSVQGLAPRRLMPVLEREQPDVVHVANPGHIGVGLMHAARARAVPVVVTVMDYWWLCPKHTLLHYRGGICDSDVPWLECIRCTGASDRRRWLRAVAHVPGLSEIVIPALYFTRALCGGSSPAEIVRWARRQRFLTAALNSANAVICLSQGARARLTPRLSHPRLHTIVVGLEPRWFGARRSERWDPAPRDPAKLTLGFVGALAEHKGPHLLLDAVRQLGWTATRVRLAGGGTDARYERRLRALAEGLNVELLGRVPSEQVPALLAGLDLLVVPSIWPENLPQTVLEAQAVGVPVVASRVDGISEAISDPTLLFDVGSAPSLARCLAGWTAAPRNPPPATPVRTADEMVAQTLGVYAAARGGD